ncbi:hypothetical protein P8C59_007428 [Phyllachora maydis]|uniref:Uncharacterized protein n=1 Tax=Phyllachora maydis TaxID=1825666 RepID=A0AAD9MDJ2_9PEZI|nr:hypothetical protein P8C59_007428 [Phyllachora maydis]
MLLHLEKQEDVRKLQFPHLGIWAQLPRVGKRSILAHLHSHSPVLSFLPPFFPTPFSVTSDTIIENGSVLQPSEAIAKFCIINPDTGDEVACRTAVALTFVNIILFLSINLLRQKPLLSLQL